jgi:hypothetical protein
MGYKSYFKISRQHNDSNVMSNILVSTRKICTESKAKLEADKYTDFSY